MNCSIASDLHLEFGDIDIKNLDAADVLILSGDIFVAADIGRPDPHDILEGKRSRQIRDFFSRCSTEFPHVIYVMGNHEHYHGDFAATADLIRAMIVQGGLTNVYLLDSEVKVIDDVTFIGGTLWTDMNGRDPLTLYHMTSMMNDFRVVKNTSRAVNFRGTDGKFHTRPARFTPNDAADEFDAMKNYISTVVQGRFDEKFVVVGHHAPSRLSVHERYKFDTIMNGGYSSDLDEFILDRPQIKLWTHGHTHHSFDYMIGSTQVVCNPRGYVGYEPQADSWQLKTVSI